MQYSALHRFVAGGLVGAGLLVCACITAEGESNKRTGETELAAVAKYKGWTSVNKRPHFVPSYLAFLCRTPRPGEKDPSPHADRFVKVFVNEKGRAAMMTKGSTNFPEGTIIVKEKLQKEEGGAPELLTVMIKRGRGFNTKNGDWEYAVFEGQGKKVKARGKLANCQSCHLKQSGQDFVFRTYLTESDRKAYNRLTAGARLAARR